MNVDRYDWKKVEAPKAWRPKRAGESIFGLYAGKSTKNGSFGQYEIVLVETEIGMFTVSGVNVIQLVDASKIPQGWPMQIVWKGYVTLSGDRKMKQFELFVAEEDARNEDMPAVVR